MNLQFLYFIMSLKKINSINSTDTNEVLNSDKIRKLRKFRYIASAILLLMLTFYIIAVSYRHQYPWLEWLKAFAEAGMIGGLADWFAVSALFRHPLGIPIPHTAIIPSKKNVIAKSLATFISTNFLSTDNLVSKAQDLKLIDHSIHFLESPENVKKIATSISATLPKLLNTLKEQKTHEAVATHIFTHLKELDPSSSIDKLVDWLLEEERYKTKLSPFLTQLALALSANKEIIDTAARDNAPLAKVPVLRRISQNIAEGMSGKATINIEEALTDASSNPESSVWSTVAEMLQKLQLQLRESQDMQQQLSTLRDQWLNEQNSSVLANNLWDILGKKLANDLDSSNPTSTEEITNIINSLTRSLAGDALLKKKLESFLFQKFQLLMSQISPKVETIIINTVQEWDSHSFSSKLETQVGADLQYIRINGTVIGGILGIIIHTIELLF